MGQFVSAARSGTCNDELVNFLITGGYILTKDVEKVLRGVDRGFYFNNEDKHRAYHDIAHQSNEIHLSAPAVYATVLECLRLQSGHKFLNIGSGVGYLSTTAGLLLGINGVNHGIEINKLLVDRAYQKMEEFKLHAAAIDHFSFCEPVFIHGNACDLLPKGYYDRVYCGAGVPSEESEFMKSLINIGGILVMPLEGSLLKITRTTEHTWSSEEIIDVVFTELVVPEKCSVNTVAFPAVEPLSLQELCKLNIRTTLREDLEKTKPKLFISTHCQLKSNTRRTKRNVLDEYVRLQYGVGRGLRNLRNFANSLVDSHDGLSETSSSSSEISSDIFLNSDLDMLNDTFYDQAAREVETEVEAETAAATAAVATHYARSSHGESTSVHESTSSVHESTSSVHESPSTSTDESTKRKSQDYAEDSEPNTASAATKNPKRMKMDSPSQNSENEQCTSSKCGSDTWSTSSSDSEGLVSIDDDDNFDHVIDDDDVVVDDVVDDVVVDDVVVDDDVVDDVVDVDDDSYDYYNFEYDYDDDGDDDEEDDVADDASYDDDDEGDSHLCRLVNSYLYENSNYRRRTERNEHGLTNEEIMAYRFVSDRKENELSKLLKVKIDSLPLPNPLKLYLNYNRID